MGLASYQIQMHPAVTIAAAPGAPRGDSSLREYRRAVTAEAVALLEQSMAAARKRRQPLTFPAPFEEGLSVMSESTQSSAEISTNTPSVNVTGEAAEPPTNSAKIAAPASIAAK